MLIDRLKKITAISARLISIVPLHFMWLPPNLCHVIALRVPLCYPSLICALILQYLPTSLLSLISFDVSGLGMMVWMECLPGLEHLSRLPESSQVGLLGFR